MLVSYTRVFMIQNSASLVARLRAGLLLVGDVVVVLFFLLEEGIVLSVGLFFDIDVFGRRFGPDQPERSKKPRFNDRELIAVAKPEASVGSHEQNQ